MLESAVDLARAEGRLAASHASHLAKHAVGALLLAIGAAALLQVTVLSVALVPVLSTWVSAFALGFLVLVPAVLTLALSYAAARVWLSAARSEPVDAARESES